MIKFKQHIKDNPFMWVTISTVALLVAIILTISLATGLIATIIALALEAVIAVIIHKYILESTLFFFDTNLDSLSKEVALLKGLVKDGTSIVDDQKGIINDLYKNLETYQKALIGSRIDHVIESSIWYTLVQLKASISGKIGDFTYLLGNSENGGLKITVTIQAKGKLSTQIIKAIEGAISVEGNKQLAKEFPNKNYQPGWEFIWEQIQEPSAAPIQE